MLVRRGPQGGHGDPRLARRAAQMPMSRLDLRLDLNLYSRRMSALTIGQVAERTGFSTSALRYYEGLGLVTPTTRTEASYRVYDDDAVTRLGFIARAKQLGCSLDEIRDLLGMWDRDRCAPVQRRFHELVTEKIHATQQQIVELIAFASQLQTAAAHLGGPSMDGPCGDDCACLERAGDADATPTPVLLMTSRAE